MIGKARREDYCTWVQGGKAASYRWTATGVVRKAEAVRLSTRAGVERFLVGPCYDTDLLATQIVFVRAQAKVRVT